MKIKFLVCHVTHVSYSIFIGNIHILGKERSSHRRCSIKKLLLKTLQYSQENTRVGVSF